MVPVNRPAILIIVVGPPLVQLTSFMEEERTLNLNMRWTQILENILSCMTAMCGTAQTGYNVAVKLHLRFFSNNDCHKEFFLRNDS